MARKSKAAMKPEMGSREGQIAGFVAGGLSDDAIWAGLEIQYPFLKKGSPGFDAEERAKCGRAIRSVRSGMIKTAAALQEDLDILGGEGEMKPASESKYENMARFNCGIPALNYLYGETYYRWTEDDPKGTFKEITVEKQGKKVQKVVMVKGRYRCGDFMPWEPGKNGIWTVDVKKFDLLEKDPLFRAACRWELGLPFSFLSIWGGQAGVGKTRLAIALAHALNAMGWKVGYYNAEMAEGQFRERIGPNVDEELFLCRHSAAISTQTVCGDAVKHKFRVVIVDSFQKLLEVQKGTEGAKRALAQFLALKADPEAEQPHIVLISQLNKKQELKGSTEFQHMVDFVARIVKRKGHDKEFLFECLDKNRGGETGRSRRFKHVLDGVECLGYDELGGETTRLKQGYELEDNAVIAAGVKLPEMQPANATGVTEDGEE